MPGEPSISANKLPSQTSKRRDPEAVPAPARPEATLAALETELARARAEYAARSATVKQVLEDIRQHLVEAQHSAPPGLEPEFGLLEASLHTLLGRLVSRRDSDASRSASQHAVELFEKYKLQIEGHKSRTRFLTDWGIALHRIGRNEESMALLSRVCEGGIAPAEAFGYLGYGELKSGKAEAAEAALRKGLEIAPADLTMSFYLAKVLEARARKADCTETPDDAIALRKVAADAYCRAGEIARNVGDFRSAALDSFRALRMQSASEEALALAVESLRSLGGGRRAFLIVEWFLRKQPDHPVALGMKGVLLRDLGKQAQSVAVLSSIRATSPDLAWVQAQLALSLSEDPSKLTEALETARVAVDLASTDWFVRRVLGLLEVDSGEYEAAASTLAKARELGDTSEEVALNLCSALISNSKYEEAQTELKVLLDAYPRSASAYYLLGVCAEHFESLDRALRYYRRASRLAPDEPTIFVKLMAILSTEDLRPQALDEIEYRLSGSLRYLALWYRGKFEAVDERLKDATQTLREAVQAAEELPAVENLPGILVDYGDVLRRHGEYENARAAYLRAYEIDPYRRDVCFGKALYHCCVAEFVEARSCVESALNSQPEDESQADLWNLHGWCLQHLGSAGEAFKSYEKAFELSGKKDPWFLKGMANVLMTFDKEKAKEHFAEILKEQKYQSGTSIVIERPSGNISTVGLLGWCNYRLGQYDEAIRLLESALGRFADNVPVQFDLALAFLASGRTRLALDAYSQGHKRTQECEPSRQRGLLYIALFDLVDARRLEVVGSGSEKILEEVKGWLSASGMALENLTWLADNNDFEVNVTDSNEEF